MDKLERDIISAKSKWPSLYVFNTSKERQKDFFNRLYDYKLDSDIIIDKEALLRKSYLQCLYIFDIIFGKIYIIGLVFGYVNGIQLETYITQIYQLVISISYLKMMHL